MISENSINNKLLDGTVMVLTFVESFSVAFELWCDHIVAEINIQYNSYCSKSRLLRLKIELIMGGFDSVSVENVDEQSH